MKRNILFIIFSTLLYSPVLAEDYYELLGISRDASNKEIRKAFKKLALRLHPDKNKDDPNAHETFLRINRAYEVLKDPELRKKYNSYGEDGLKENHFSNNYQSWNYFNEEFGLYDDDPEIISLSYTDFQMSVEGSDDVWFINYYSPFCSHCHDLAPTWRQVAKELEGVVRMGAINCQEDWSLCRQQGIQSYPSLILYPSQHLYRGQRTERALIRFILDALDVKIVELTHENFNAETAVEQQWLIDFCEPSSDCLSKDTTTKLASILDNVVTIGSVDCSHEEKLCNSLGYNGAIVYFEAESLKAGKGTVIKSLDAKDIAEQVLKLTPDPLTVDSDTFEDIRHNLKTGSQPWLVHFDNTAEVSLEIRKLPGVINDMKVGHVDCTATRGVCDFLHLTKYPMVALFKKGGFEWHYGRFTAHDIAVFAKESAASNVQTLGPDDFPDGVITPNRPFFVDFFAPWCPPCMKLLPEYRKASRSFIGKHNIGFGTVDCTIHVNLCHTYNIQSYPTTILYNNTIPIQFSGHHSAGELIDFVENTLSPSVVELTPETFESLVSQKEIGDTWLVDFYAPWCGPCQELLPNWNKLAKRVKGEAHVGSVDCVKHRNFCSEQSVRSYPTIRLYPHSSSGSWEYVVHQGWRDEESLYTWTHQNLPSIVTDVTHDIFYNEILSSTEPWLLDFFAPWCGPCMRFAPYFERVAKLFGDKVRAGKINCEQESQLCHQAGIHSYPTVRLYLGAQQDGMTQQIEGEMSIETQKPEEIYEIVKNAVEERQREVEKEERDERERRGDKDETDEGLERDEMKPDETDEGLEHDEMKLDEREAEKNKHEEKEDMRSDEQDRVDETDFELGGDSGHGEDSEDTMDDSSPPQTPVHDEF